MVLIDCKFATATTKPSIHYVTWRRYSNRVQIQFLVNDSAVTGTGSQWSGGPSPHPNNNNNNNHDNVYGAVIVLRALREFTRFTRWMQQQRQVAADLWTKPTDVYIVHLYSLIMSYAAWSMKLTCVSVSDSYQWLGSIVVINVYKRFFLFWG